MQRRAEHSAPVLGGLHIALLACTSIVPGDVRAQYAADDFALTECGANPTLFRSGLEPAEGAQSRPSGGSGGIAPGDSTLVVSVPDTGFAHNVYLHLPATYDPLAAWPLMVVLHGASGSSAQTPAAASAMRSLWQPTADAEGVILLAPAASGAQGGWVPALDTPALACAIAEVERRYNVDRARRYLWGFSAGGHFAHSLALGNADRFAGYAAKAGTLVALACDTGGGSNDCATTLPTVARRIPVHLRVGTSDPLRSLVEGDRIRLQNAGWVFGADLIQETLSGGHQVFSADVQTAWGWLATRVHVP